MTIYSYLQTNRYLCIQTKKQNTIKIEEVVEENANVLVESEIAIEIVNSANIDKDTCVIEIGPGLGALTEIALEKAGLVMAFEIDANMVNIYDELDKYNQAVANKDESTKAQALYLYL